MGQMQHVYTDISDDWQGYTCLATDKKAKKEFLKSKKDLKNTCLATDTKARKEFLKSKKDQKIGKQLNNQDSKGKKIN